MFFGIWKLVTISVSLKSEGNGIIWTYLDRYSDILHLVWKQILSLDAVPLGFIVLSCIIHIVPTLNHQEVGGKATIFGRRGFQFLK